MDVISTIFAALSCAGASSHRASGVDLPQLFLRAGDFDLIRFFRVEPVAVSPPEPTLLVLPRFVTLSSRWLLSTSILCYPRHGAISSPTVTFPPHELPFFLTILWWIVVSQYNTLQLRLFQSLH